MLVILAVMLIGYIVASVNEEFGKAPYEREVIVEMDLTSEVDVAEKTQIIENLLDDGYWIVGETKPDETHKEITLHGLVDGNGKPL